MKNLNITRDLVEVLPGQVWRDLDKRMGGRTVTVLSVTNGRALVQGVRPTTLSVRRMHRHSTGWALVK